MNIGKSKTIEFIKKLEILAGSVDELRVVRDESGEYNEKNYLQNLVKEANELIAYHEWLIALENTLDNLHEVNYKLSDDILELAEAALESVPDKSGRQELIGLLRG